jgi:hypothetical protein
MTLVTVCKGYNGKNIMGIMEIFHNENGFNGNVPQGEWIQRKCFTMTMTICNEQNYFSIYDNNFS